MERKIFVNNPWGENSVVLYDETKEAVIIDCGCFSNQECQLLQNFIDKEGLKLVGLLNTHLHIDHIFGNNFIKENYHLEPQASKRDDYLIEDAIGHARKLGMSGVEQPPAIGKYIEEGDIIRFGNSELKVIAVPGHTPGGICFYSEKDKLLVSGDVLFNGSIGRSDLTGGNGQELLEGISEKLFTLPEDVEVIPGHGPSTTIGYEKKHNPFF